jgi:hypothetical protein
MQKKIVVPKGWTKILANEFELSPQSVRMALAYVFNSERSIAITEKVKEMFQEQIKLIEKQQ